MEQLRDIKDLVEVTDYSLYYLLGVLGVGAIVVLLLAFYIYQFIHKKVPLTQQKMAVELLKKLDIDDAKESAYTFSHLAQYAVGEAQNETLQEILSALEPYKYKKEVPPLDAALKEKMQKFIKELGHG